MHYCFFLFFYANLYHNRKTNLGNSVTCIDSLPSPNSQLWIRTTLVDKVSTCQQTREKLIVPIAPDALKLGSFSCLSDSFLLDLSMWCMDRVNQLHLYGFFFYHSKTVNLCIYSLEKQLLIMIVAEAMSTLGQYWNLQMIFLYTYFLSCLYEGKPALTTPDIFLHTSITHCILKGNVAYVSFILILKLIYCFVLNSPFTCACTALCESTFTLFYVSSWQIFYWWCDN